MSASAFSVIGAGAAGAILQVQSTTITTRLSTTSNTFVDITGLNVTITPKFANSQIYVTGTVSTGASTTSGPYIQIVRGSTPIGIGTGATGSQVNVTSAAANSGNDGLATMPFNFLDSPATTSATTYKIQYLSQSGTVVVNQTYNNGNIIADSVGVSTITVMEVNNNFSLGSNTPVNAWVNFSAAPSTVTINGNFGISSMAYNSTGNYTANYGTAYADTNYAIIITPEPQNGAQYGLVGGINTKLAKATTSSQIATGTITSVMGAASPIDVTSCNAIYVGT